MKKKLLVIVTFLLLLVPLNVFAISDKYKDVISEIVDRKVEDDKINIYLFRGSGCPHCADEEEFLEKIMKEYGDYINIYDFEVFKNADNLELMKTVADEFETTATGVPFTIIGEEYFKGFSSVTKSKIENTIKDYLDLEVDKNIINIPLLGDVNIKNVSIPLVAVILGFIDGFNPCAMWILLFLISMLFRMENKKKRWILGFTFLLVSGLVYFISMIGINLVLGLATIKIIKVAIAVFILIAGLLNLKKYIEIKDQDAGCTVVVDDKKRKIIINKTKKIINNKNFVLSLIGISLLAASVNLVELACSLGFPVIFSEILAVNNIKGITKIIYLLIYILFYMLDDMVVFTISMVTIEATGVTNKYNKLCTLVSSIIMIIIGLLLLIKPEWVMFNF